MNPKPELSVVVPTYNERDSLPHVVESIHRALAGVPHEIIVADDDSPDGTWEWVEAASRQDPCLRLIRRRAHPGLGASVIEAFGRAQSDRWIVMDADGQHDVRVLPLLHKMLGTHELVVASRYASGGGTGRWHLGRWLASKLSIWLAQLILNVHLSDPMSGFFGLRREAFAGVASKLDPQGFKILAEVYYWLGKREPGRRVTCIEVPYVFGKRLHGESKLGGRVAWEYVRMLFQLRRHEPPPQALPKFLIVGAIGVVVNSGVLLLLVRSFGLHYLLSSVVAIQVSIVHNFIWHDNWTFMHWRGTKSWVKRLWQYQLATLAGLVANWGVLAALVGLAGWPLLLSNLIGIGCGTLLNFSISKIWTWSPRAEVLDTSHP